MPDTRRILVVEDDGPIRDLLSRFLAQSGYTVIVAANGPEALRLSAKLPRIDLLITDVKMPYLSGPEVASRVAAGHRETRVLFISGYLSSVEWREPPKAWFLAKPFTSADLISKIKEILGPVE